MAIAFNVASNVNIFVSHPGIKYFNSYIDTSITALKEYTIKLKIISLTKYKCHKIYLYENLDKGHIILYRRLGPVSIINNYQVESQANVSINDFTI